MIEITGKYNTAKVFTNNLDEKSREQIELLCEQEFVKGSTLRLMPDVHAGAGCTIGTTMTIKDKIVPNLVGVDIGCGMETIIISKDDQVSREFDPAKLDKWIHKKIPCGRNVQWKPHEFAETVPLANIRCPKVNLHRARLSIGTLGGGNHFIEAGRDENEHLYIVIHSGSRHLGLEIAEWYQEEAWNQLNGKRRTDTDAVISQLKAEGRETEIQSRIAEIKAQIVVDIPKDLAYVAGDLFDDYINDMKITQLFADTNRKAMMQIILNGLGIKDSSDYENFTTVHNYIDTDSMILRKGAVSAKTREKLLIPINMRDGSLVCEGLGNPDWNYSAPHGAGRLMSRNKAFKTLSLDDFREQMSGIYSSSVHKGTLDESPMAYKDMDDIVRHITPTARIINIVKPMYNFKSAE
ncbi:MAG: RtcB family protein [Treponema sp.]|nr:RtcB family protein [Treponema sp.]